MLKHIWILLNVWQPIPIINSLLQDHMIIQLKFGICKKLNKQCSYQIISKFKFILDKEYGQYSIRMTETKYYLEVLIQLFKYGILRKVLSVQDLRHTKIKFIMLVTVNQIKILLHVELEEKFIFGMFKIHQNQ